VRKGKWKFVRDLLGGNEKELLFDLAVDVSERHTVAYEHPEILNDMRNLLRAWEKDVGDHTGSSAP